MITLTKNKMLDMLARCEMGLADRRSQEGMTASASALFADSARKYEYLASLREEKRDGIRTLEHALMLAKRSGDAKRTYSIATKISELELFSEKGLAVVELKGNGVDFSNLPFIRGVPKVTELDNREMAYYNYRIDLGNGKFAKLIDALGDGELKRIVDATQREIVTIEDEQLEKSAILLSYKDQLSLMSIYSKHRSEDANHIKNAINIIGNSFELLLS